jgi:hypothetical protein
LQHLLLTRTEEPGSEQSEQTERTFQLSRGNPVFFAFETTEGSCWWNFLALIRCNNNDQHGKQERKQKSKLCKWIPNDSSDCSLTERWSTSCDKKAEPLCIEMLDVSFVFSEFKLRLRDIARTNEPEMRLGRKHNSNPFRAPPLHVKGPLNKDNNYYILSILGYFLSRLFVSGGLFLYFLLLVLATFFFTIR